MRHEFTRRWLCTGTLSQVVWQKLTDVSKILTTSIIGEMDVFLEVEACSVVETDRRFRIAIGQFLPDYAAQHPRRQPYLY
jgi:hypothetical protein